MTQRNQFARNVQPRPAFLCVCLVPVKLRPHKGIYVIGIRYGFIVPGMAGKLFRAPLPHGFRQVAVEVGEKEERMRFAILLTHKQQRDMWRQEQRRE